MTGARAIPPASLPRATAFGLLVALASSACISKDEAKKLVEGFQASRPSRPDGLPVMLNRDNPVRYPPTLYASRAQGNVTLRIFVDSGGRVHPESTRVIEPSSDPAFDSAAVTGIREARFSPATRHGKPVAVSILFPVYFRHPQGAPVPGDSVLHRALDSLKQPVGSGATRPTVGDSGSNGQSGRSRTDGVAK